jgi:hypothetical protein
MDDSAIHTVLGIAVTVLTMGLGGLMAWMFWVQRAMLTREEHERICMIHHSETLRKLDMLSAEIKNNDLDARRTREELKNQLGAVVTDVSVLKDRDVRRTDAA